MNFEEYTGKDELIPDNPIDVIQRLLKSPDNWISKATKEKYLPKFEKALLLEAELSRINFPYMGFEIEIPFQSINAIGKNALNTLHGLCEFLKIPYMIEEPAGRVDLKLFEFNMQPCRNPIFFEIFLDILSDERFIPNLADLNDYELSLVSVHLNLQTSPSIGFSSGKMIFDRNPDNLFYHFYNQLIASCALAFTSLERLQRRKIVTDKSFRVKRSKIEQRFLSSAAVTSNQLRVEALPFGISKNNLKFGYYLLPQTILLSIVNNFIFKNWKYIDDPIPQTIREFYNEAIEIESGNTLHELFQILPKDFEGIRMRSFVNLQRLVEKLISEERDVDKRSILQKLYFFR